MLPSHLSRISVVERQSNQLISRAFVVPTRPWTQLHLRLQAKSRFARQMHTSEKLTCYSKIGGTVQTNPTRIPLHHTQTFNSTNTSSSTKLSPYNNTFKISQRSAQIARHFSSSSSDQKSTISDSNMASKYTVRKIGAPNTLEHRIYIEKDGVPISSFHDIPLYANAEQTILNMVVEIPRWTNGKLEVRFLLAYIAIIISVITPG